MRHDAHQAQPPREPIDKAKYDLETDDRVDEFGKESLRNNGVLLDELGEIIQAGGYEEALRQQSRKLDKLLDALLFSHFFFFLYLYLALRGRFQGRTYGECQEAKAHDGAEIPNKR